MFKTRNLFATTTRHNNTNNFSHLLKHLEFSEGRGHSGNKILLQVTGRTNASRQRSSISS